MFWFGVCGVVMGTQGGTARDSHRYRSILRKYTGMGTFTQAFQEITSFL